MSRELQDYSVSDWVNAQNSLSNSEFSKLKRLAQAGNIILPSIVAPNYSPRIQIDSRSESDIEQYMRIKDTEALERFNSSVKEWSRKVENELKQSAQSNFGHRNAKDISALQPRLSDSIKANVRFDKKYKLETRSVGFSIARHGVYLHQGAGRGYGGLIGSQWTDKYGNLKKTNPDSIGKQGTGNRKAEHWFNSVIEKNAPELVEILADYSLDLVLNLSSVFLPW